MSPRFSLAAALLLALSASSFAADDAVNLAGYHLKNRSVFNLTPGMRPPFWPIGWVHRAGGGPAQEAAPEKTMIETKMFSVTSILMGHPAFAVINHRSYSEGELLKGTKQAPATWPASAKVRVQKISDGSVTLVSDAQTVVVPMVRPELSDHKSESDAESELLQNNNN